MSKAEITKFNVCKELIKLLGNKQTIADCNKLYYMHPEMFKNKQNLKNTIKQVINKPDLILKNSTTKTNKSFRLYKKVNTNKIADICICNSGNIKTIFHANKRNIKNFDKFVKQVANGRCAHFLHPDLKNRLGLADKPHSSATQSDIIQQSNPKSQGKADKKPKSKSKSKQNDFENQM